MVIVDVTPVAVGTGPTVSVEPSVVIVVGPVMIEPPDGIVSITVCPSGSVSVSIVGVVTGVLMGPTVMVEPPEVMTVDPVIVDPGGKVNVTVDPSGWVTVCVTEPPGGFCELTGPTVIVEPP